jgi:CheY-like chemotaxis protein
MAQLKHPVLLADDSIDDRLFMRMALARSSMFRVVAEVSDGEEAINYLKGTDPFQDRSVYPWPEILLLDLKMPRKNGFDVLEWIKSVALANIKVFVLSGSFLEQDITRSLQLGAHGYFKKTAARPELEKMIGELKQLVIRPVASNL